jgi:hypothetical protein
MSWRSSDSAGDPHVKGRWRAGRGASGLAMVAPHAVAAAVGGKYGRKRSGQGDFVKLAQDSE